MEETISMIKSCVVSRKGGVPLLELNGEYQELVGELIPFEKLGFQSLGSFISSIPEINILRNEAGVMMLSLRDEKVAHISALVNKQKDPPRKQKKRDVFKTSFQNKKREEYGKRRKVQEFSSDFVEKENSYSRQSNASKKNNTTNTYSLNKTSPVRMNKTSPVRMNKTSPVRNERKVLHPRKINGLHERKGHRSNHNRPFDRILDEYSNDYRLPSPSNSCDKHCSRQATMVGDLLTVTVKNTHCASAEYSDNGKFVDENILFCDNDFDELIGDKAPEVLRISDDLQSYVEPTLFHHQMIGDDFFLHLAEKSLGAHTDRRRNLLYSSGLCISGQTIQECRQRISVDPILGNNVILLLGAVDILKGTGLADLKSNILDLLDTLMPQVRSAIILTAPPLINVCHIEQKWLILQSFNRWLKKLDTGKRCRVLDIWPLFQGQRVEMYEYFENFPRKLVGSSASAVLWNNWGRKIVIEFLRGKLLFQDRSENCT